MKVLKLFLVLTLPILTSCANSEKSPSLTMGETVLPIKPSGELVRGYALSDDFIDVDFKAVEYANVNPAARSEDVTEEDRAKMKAAVYRFNKHVSVVDGLYYCSIKNGAEINISEDLFKYMIDNLDEMNGFIKEYTEKGENVDVIEPTEEYLESLLK